MPNETKQLAADSTVVFDLMDDLKNAWDKILAEYHEPVSGVDLMIVVHNFHKLVLQNMAADRPADQRWAFLELAEKTFREAMEKARGPRPW